MKETNNNCVYLHVNLDKQEIFYVGIGSEKRPYDRSDRGIHWKRLTKKHHYAIIIIHRNLTWQEACDLEKYYIKQIGRKDKDAGTLINYTDGGEGTKGINIKPWSKERKKAQSLRLKGKNTGPRPEEIKKRISLTKQNNPKTFSQEERLKISKRIKGKNNPFFGKTHSDKTKNKISETKKKQKLIGTKNHNFGKKLSKQTKDKIKKAHNNISLEEKKYRSESKKGKNNPFFGKTHSKEFKNKLSKKIVQKDLNENVIKIWDSISEAAKHFKVNSTGIWFVLRGINKAAQGFKWEYL